MFEDWILRERSFVTGPLLGLGGAGVHALDSVFARTGSLCVSKVEIRNTDAKSVAQCLLENMAGMLYFCILRRISRFVNIVTDSRRSVLLQNSWSKDVHADLFHPFSFSETT